MDSRKSVFFLPRWFPLPNDPLWGSFVLNHALAIQPHINVFVIYTDSTNDPAQAGVPQFAEVQGVPVLYLFYRQCNIRGIGLLVNALRMLLCWHKAWKFGVIRWGMPHLNHVHVLTRLGIFALIVKWRYGIQYVITEHWSRYLPMNLFYKGFLRKIATRIVVRNAQAVMPVSHHLRRALERFSLKNPNYKVVPNVVDTDVFVPLVQPNRSRPFTFIHVSAFDERAKNTLGIIRVVARLAQEHPGFIMKMIGDGAGRADAEKLAEALFPAGDVIRFQGVLTPAEVADNMADSDMLVLFSNYENLPVVILEAFSCGVPVLATKVGGVPEIVNQSNGVLVDAGDEEALFQAMSEVLVNGIFSFNPKEIRRFAVENFSIQAVGSSILQIYHQAMKTPRHD